MMASLLGFQLLGLIAHGSPGTWTLTGSMATARSRHTATLLPNGRMLVTGGLDAANSSTASAELYDPDFGAWQATASMGETRSRHTATLILTGKVLVAGGRNADGLSLATAELYDPGSGTWTATGEMATPRDIHSATLLADGRVLVAGGQNTGQFGRPVERTAEIYDPETGLWGAADHLANARYGHEAVRLPDGQVFVAGGSGPGGDCVPLQTAELFDPQTGRWHNALLMPTARGFYFAALLPTGVLVAGGLALPATCDNVTANAELYNPSTGAWSATGPMSLARGGIIPGAVLVDGRVVVVGGKIQTEAGLAKTETADLYNPAIGTWSLTGSMSTVRTSHAVTLLLDGRVLVTGGRDLTTTLATAEVYTP